MLSPSGNTRLQTGRVKFRSKAGLLTESQAEMLLSGNSSDRVEKTKIPLLCVSQPQCSSKFLRGTKAVTSGASLVDVSKPTTVIYQPGRGTCPRKALSSGNSSWLFSLQPPWGSSAAFIFANAALLERVGGGLNIWLERTAPFCAGTLFCPLIVCSGSCHPGVTRQDPCTAKTPDRICLRVFSGWPECSGNLLTLFFIGTESICAQANPSLTDRKPRLSDPNICLFHTVLTSAVLTFPCRATPPPLPTRGNVKNSWSEAQTEKLGITAVTYGHRCAQLDSNLCHVKGYVPKFRHFLPPQQFRGKEKN